MLNKYQKLLLFFIFLGVVIISPNFILAQKPVASAGPDQAVYENHSILLQGSAVDATPEHLLNYSWSCTGGNLSDSNMLQPVFRAPSVTQNTSFVCTLTAYNNYSENSSSFVNILVREYALPNVDLKANGYNDLINLTKYGFVVLTWDSANATSCHASDDWSGSKPIIMGFERRMNISSSRKYTLTCTGPGGSMSDTMIVNVKDPDAPGVDIWANDSRIFGSVLYGSSVTLYWTSDNTNSCYASGDWYGTKSIVGVEKIENITSSKIYTITCFGKNNLISSAQVKVNISN